MLSICCCAAASISFVRCSSLANVGVEDPDPMAGINAVHQIKHPHLHLQQQIKRFGGLTRHGCTQADATRRDSIDESWLSTLASEFDNRRGIVNADLTREADFFALCRRVSRQGLLRSGSRLPTRHRDQHSATLLGPPAAVSKLTAVPVPTRDSIRNVEKWSADSWRQIVNPSPSPPPSETWRFEISCRSDSLMPGPWSTTVHRNASPSRTNCMRIKTDSPSAVTRIALATKIDDQSANHGWIRKYAELRIVNAIPQDSDCARQRPRT